MAIESVSPQRISGAQLKEMRDHYFPLMQNTRAAATRARALLAGELGVTLPESVVLAGADAWVADLPHKRMAPQRLRQKLIARRWEIKRAITSAGYRAQSVSSRLEAPLNAIMKVPDQPARFPWEDVNDLLLLEGLAFSTVTPSPADWQAGPTLYAGDGNLEKRFAMDRGGRFPGDDGYDAEDVDLDAARRDQQAEMADFCARHLPFRQRAYSIRQCAPIWDGSGVLEGLIVEEHWSVQSLLRRKVHVRGAKGDRGQFYPLGALGEGDAGVGASGKPLKVTTAYLMDDDGPYIAYMVDDQEAWVPTRDGSNLEPWVVDLTKLGPNRDKALTRLPVSWGWGLGWSAADIDQRAMGFTEPLWRSWRNIDSIMTSLIMFAQMRALPPLIEEVPLGMGADEGGIDDDEPETPDIQPGKITRVHGKVTEVGTQGPPPQVFQAIAILMGENKEAAGSEGGDANSGFQLSLAEGFQLDALTTVHQSALKMAGMNASFILEQAKILGEAYKPIRVYQIADVLLEQDRPSAVDQLLELDPALIGTSYDVKAIHKATPGEDPTRRQQDADFVERGLMTTREFLERDGDPAPEATVAEIKYERILDSEPGMQATMRILENFVSDRFLEQIQEAISSGQANKQGVPTAFAQGTTPPPDMLMPGQPATGAGMPGLGVPNPAEQSLMGSVGGGMQVAPINNATQAGGVLPAAGLPTGA